MPKTLSPEEQKRLQEKADSQNLLYMMPPEVPNKLARFFNTASAKKFKKYHELIGVKRPGFGWRTLDSIAKFWGSRVSRVEKYEREYQIKGHEFRHKNLRERALKQRQAQKAKQQKPKQPKLRPKQPMPKDLKAEFQKQQLAAMQKQNELLQKQIEQQAKMMELLQKKLLDPQPEKTKEQPIVNEPEKTNEKVDEKVNQEDKQLPEKNEDKANEKQAIEADEETKLSSFKQAETGKAQKTEQDLMQKMETTFGKEALTDHVRSNLSKLMEDDASARKSMGKAANNSKNGMVKLDNKDVSSMLAYNKVMQRINSGDKSVLSELDRPNAAQKIEKSMSWTRDAKYLSGERKVEDIKKVFDNPTELNKVTDRAGKQIEDTIAKLFGTGETDKKKENPQVENNKLPQGAIKIGKYNYRMKGNLNIKTIPGMDEKAAKEELAKISQSAKKGLNPKTTQKTKQVNLNKQQPKQQTMQLNA